MRNPYQTAADAYDAAWKAYETAAAALRAAEADTASDDAAYYANCAKTRAAADAAQDAWQKAAVDLSRYEERPGIPREEYQDAWQKAAVDLSRYEERPGVPREEYR